MVRRLRGVQARALPWGTWDCVQPLCGGDVACGVRSTSVAGLPSRRFFCERAKKKLRSQICKDFLVVGIHLCGLLSSLGLCMACELYQSS